MRREALVVGINLYEPYLRDLRAPADDAAAIAQVLKQYGNFKVKTLPGPNQEGRIAKARVSKERLEEAIIDLFKPNTDNTANISNSALLFFSGHGLRRTRGVSEGFLATSDVNLKENWGVSLRWLHDLLRASPVQQQLVWLDCCYSGEFMNFLEELKQADPGNAEQRDRCFIAASLDYKVAYETGGRGILTAALLQALDPRDREDGTVTNLTLSLAVAAALRQGNQEPLYANFGNTIVITGHQAEAVRPALVGMCPYKGLEPFEFNDEDPKYFYGRRALTDSLLDQVRTGNFLAVVGASGSGKSSVVRAGLLHELQQGERLSGSQDWLIYTCRPGKEPLRSLARALVTAEIAAVSAERSLHTVQHLEQDGAAYLVELVAALSASRVVLVIDQFEECFTLCKNHPERQQFFDCLLGAVERSDNKLCLVLTMRADFFSKCLNYAGLARAIEENLVTVKPLNSEELQEAIVQPAKQVGVEVQPELVTQMITDVESSPGSLPLLQYTLKQLWEQRTVNLLTVSAYSQLGGIRGTLQKRADQVYDALGTAEKQEVARRIFLELTQLGDGTEDTRRQVPQQELITDTDARSQILVEEVIRTLTDARLIVTSEQTEKSPAAGRVEVVDIAHETLIRHWSRLRKWIEDSRIALKQKRDIEDAAEEWLDKGKPKELAYLLQGRKLQAAEEFLNTHAATVPLSQQAKEFIHASQRDRTTRRLRTGSIAAAVLLALTGAGVFSWNQSIQERYAQVIRDAAIGQARPELWPVACQLRKEADQSSQVGNTEDALENYRVVLTFTNLLNKKSNSPKNTSDCSQKFEEVTDKDFYKDTENALAKLVKNQRLKKLEDQLKAGQFRGRNQNFDVKLADLDNQFTEGALRTTYAILINAISPHEGGIKADLNNDGILNNQEEADRMPCRTLKEIEQLWRDRTGKRCGWYGPDSNNPNNQPACRELSGYSLAEPIFINAGSYDYAEKRINSCKILKSNNSHS